MRSPFFAATLLALTALNIVTTVAHAGDIAWSDPDTGQWDAAENWSGGAVPGPSDNASIANATVTVVDERTVNGLTLSDNAVLIADTGASLTAISPVTLDNALLFARDGATIAFTSATTLTWSTCQPAATVVSADGGVIDLAGLTTIQLNVPDCDELTLNIEAESNGAIDLSGLEAVTTEPGQRVAFSIQTGGAIDLSALAAATGADFAVGGSSMLELPALTVVEDGSFATIGNATLTADALIEATNVDIGPGGPDTISLDALETLTSSAVAVPNDTTFTLPALETVIDTNIGIANNGLLDVPELATLESSTGMHLLSAIGGGMIAAPALTSARNCMFNASLGGILDLSAISAYTWDVCFSGPTFNANNAGSILDLSGIQTINVTPENCANANVSATATNGGVVDLAGLQTIAFSDTQTASFLATGPGSEIDLSALVTFPLLQVSFLELNQGVIHRSNGNNNEGNGDTNGNGNGPMCAASRKNGGSVMPAGDLLVVIAAVSSLAALAHVRRRALRKH